jgi:hypothetical protein
VGGSIVTAFVPPLWVSELWKTTIGQPENVMYHFRHDSNPIRLPSTTRRIRWLLALPKLGIVLLLVALVSLLWLLHRNEIEEDRAALIKDVLWLEQSLQFHLNSNEEQIQQLALDMASLPDRRKAFRLRAEHMLKNSPEVAQILWLDRTQGRRRPAQRTAGAGNRDLRPIRRQSGARPGHATGQNPLQRAVLPG